MNHPTWLLPLDNSAGLVLTPCPGTKGVSLVESIEQLKAQGVTVVVTALSGKEMEQAGVGDLPNVVAAQGLQWFSAPIEDDDVPDAQFARLWHLASPNLHRALKLGEKVALHCMGGSGRTGLLSAHLLGEQGWPVDKVIAEVQALRPGAFTKTKQIEYVHQLLRAE